MSRKRSKWKFSPARRRRPVERISEDSLETGVVSEIEETPEEELPEEEILEGETLEEETPDEEALEEETPDEEIPDEEALEEEILDAEILVVRISDEENLELEKFLSEPADTEPADTEPADTESPVSDATEAESADDETAGEDVDVETAAVMPAVTPTLPEEPAAEAEPETAVPEEPAAPIELPDYYFDEEDEFPEEDDLPEENSFLEEDPLSEEAETESAGFTETDRPADDDIFVDEGTETEVEEFLDDDIDGPDDELDDLDDELDDLDDEPQLSIYERGGQGKKDGKKKGAGKDKKEKKQGVEKKVVTIGDLVVGDGVPKVCVPITGRNKDQIVEQTKEIMQAGPDLVEWRVDYLEEAGGKKDIIDILIAIRRVIGDTPLLFTYRTESEGGYGRVGWGHYAELLEWAACRPEIDIIDVEAMGLDVDTEGLIRIIHGRGTPVIASVHYCGEMPGKKERKEALRFLKQSGGDMIKMAFTPRTEEDVLELMAWTRRKSRKMEQPLITMAMGEVGRLSRVSGRLTGSAVTFGSVGEASAAGQIPAGELKNILDQL